jgi:aminoglycoside phosphotransferase (APT) family kinase protein
MQGSLGEKIGEGKFADVHAWAPGQVLKLWKAGVPQRTVSHEARMIRAVFAAGVPAPEVFGEVTLEGRFGIVLTRLDGPTLAHLSRTGAMTLQQVGAILATLAMDLHGTPPPAAVLSLRDWMDHSMRGAGDRIPRHIADGILTLIDRLPPSGGLCHCDLHPGNVIMTADGPRLIDWGGATRAPPGLDLAWCHFFLSELAPERVPDPERPRAVNAAMQSEYARQAGMSPAALTAAMEPYLPIIQVRFLLGPAASPALRERLLQRVEATLNRPED